MSTTRWDGTKILLPRSGPDEFWQRIQDHYAHEDLQKWKYLAMLALRENAGWPLEQIGLTFGHSKGHVTRCLARIKQELRDRFAISTESWEADEGLDPERLPAQTQMPETVTMCHINDSSSSAVPSGCSHG